MHLNVLLFHQENGLNFERGQLLLFLKVPVFHFQYDVAEKTIDPMKFHCYCYLFDDDCLGEMDAKEPHGELIL